MRSAHFVIWVHAETVTMRDRRVRQQTCQGDKRGLRGIQGQERARLLQAVNQGFQQFSHGIQAVPIERCSSFIRRKWRLLPIFAHTARNKPPDKLSVIV